MAVRDTDSGGQVHEADVAVTRPSSAGTTVPVWLDRTGRIAPAPAEALDAVVVGLVVGLGITAAGGLLLVLAWTNLQHAVDVRNAAAWAREWETVEREWSGRRQ